MLKIGPLKTTALIAGLIFVVGLGNVWIGASKGRYYERAIIDATVPSRAHPLGKHAADSPFVKTLRSRSSYYRVVTAGGWILTFGALAAMLWSRKAKGYLSL